MPASLVLKTIELTEDAPRKGFAVVTASTYDGREGVQITNISLPPVRFKRPRQQGWTYHFAGRRTAHPAVGRNPRRVRIHRLSHRHVPAGQGHGDRRQDHKRQPVLWPARWGCNLWVPFLQATEPILNAIATMAGTRMVGALTGSERDESGTKQDWTLRRQEGDVFFTLTYSVA